MSLPALDTEALDEHRELPLPSWWVLAVVVLLVAAMVPWYFYSPDDLFIHLRFADNLVHRGEWAFNPGQPSAAATSPPWVLLLAIPLAAGAPGSVAAKALATLAAAGLVLLVASACRRAGAAPELAALATVCVVGSHWLRLWSAAGMETPLPALLLVAGVVWGLGLRPRPLLAGLVLGAATTARPDAIPAALVLLAFALWRCDRPQRIRLLGAALGAAMAWPLLSFLLLGRWLPLTMLPLGARDGATQLPELVVPSVLRTAAVAASEMLPLLVLAVAAVLTDGEVRRRWRLWLAPFLAAATLPIGYAASQNTGSVAATGRSLVPWFILLVLASFLVLAPWWQERRRRRWVITAAALTLLQSATLSVIHAPATRRYDDYYRRSLLPAATWLRHNAGPDDWVAAGDIGVLGSVGQIRVLDIGGAINPEAREWAHNGTTFAALQQLQPRYVMAPDRYPGFDPGQLDPYTVDTVLSTRHTSYRWSLHPGEIEVSLRVLDWQRAQPQEEPREQPP